MNINKNLIQKMNKFILNKISPDLVFVHIVNQKNLVRRLKLRKNKNRYDLFDQKKGNGFLWWQVRGLPKTEK